MGKWLLIWLKQVNEAHSIHVKRENFTGVKMLTCNTGSHYVSFHKMVLHTIDTKPIYSLAFILLNLKGFFFFIHLAGSIYRKTLLFPESRGP